MFVMIMDSLKKAKKERDIILITKSKNDTIIKFLLPGDTFMPEIDLKQHRFAFSACGQFT